MSDVAGNGALEKQCQGNCHLLNLSGHQPAQLYRPEMISFDHIAQTVYWQTNNQMYVCE